MIDGTRIRHTVRGTIARTDNVSVGRAPQTCRYSDESVTSQSEATLCDVFPMGSFRLPHTVGPSQQSSELVMPWGGDARLSLPNPWPNPTGGFAFWEATLELSDEDEEEPRVGVAAASSTGGAE